MIRPATPDDIGEIASLIAELATYERLSDQVTGDGDALREHLFGARPSAEVLIASEADEVVGFALFFHTFSTFLARPGIHLEDLFVREHHRGAGHGTALLRSLATLAVERGCGRIEWNVLDWNERAIGFYQALGAEPVAGWTVYRVAGTAIERLASAAGR